jgi:glc operon protein GlcG
MKTKYMLTLADTMAMAQAAQAEAQRNGWPVSIAIVDDGGHLLWLQRGDGASPASAQITIGRAQTAALGRRDSKFYEEMLAARPAFLSAPGLGCLLEGGVPVIADQQVPGAVGVSGVKSAEDAQVARAACMAVMPV